MALYFSYCGLYNVLTAIYLIFICRCGRKIFNLIVYGIYIFINLFFLLITLVIVNFFIQSVLQLISGVTTMERATNSRMTSMGCNCEWMKKVKNLPYDVGWVANFERMFAKGGWYCLWPFTNYKDLGFDFAEIPSYTAPPIDTESVNNEKDYLEEVEMKYKDTNIQYDNLLEINNIE